MSGPFARIRGQLLESATVADDVVTGAIGLQVKIEVIRTRLANIHAGSLLLTGSVDNGRVAAAARHLAAVAEITQALANSLRDSANQI